MEPRKQFSMTQTQAALYYSTWQYYRLHRGPNRGHRHDGCTICDAYEFTLNTLVEMSKRRAQTMGIMWDDPRVSYPYPISLESRVQAWLSGIKVASDLGGQHE